MELGNYINLVFKFSQSTDSSAYSIVRQYSDYGDLDQEQVRILTNYTEFESKFEFDTKESLTAFAQTLVNESGCEGVYLLAVNDFNIGMESIHNLLEFKSIFSSYGTLIEPESSFKKSKSLLGRFF